MSHRSIAIGPPRAAMAAVPLLVAAAGLALVSGAVVAITPAGPGFALAVALAYVPVAGGVLLALPRGHPHSRFGVGNGLTLTRAAVACLAAGVAVAPAALSGPAVLAWLPLAGAGSVILLDVLDGWLARREGVASAFGARFDMEIDAWGILMLSVVAVTHGAAPAWALCIGLLRYLYLLAGWLYSPLARPLPPSLRRRAICGLQVAALGTVLAPPLVEPAAAAVAGVGLGVLTLSFALDALWCLRVSVRS